MRDFFISFTAADSDWAEWIAWQLESAGYTTYLQDWDFGLGANFISKMHEAAIETRHTVIVLSPDFLKSRYAEAEWTAALVQDPQSTARKILPICVKQCDPRGLLGPLVRLDLTNKTEHEARTRLISEIQAALGLAAGQRAKPKVAPQWPGAAPSKKQAPEFPPHLHGLQGRSWDFGAPKLDQIRASRSPIVIALETKKEPIAASVLLPVERHLTVQLSDEAVETLVGYGRPERFPLTEASMEHIKAAGQSVWKVLLEAQPRLRRLFENAHRSELPQPVAWTGRLDLLQKIYRAILIARLNAGDEPDSILSVGFGDHYFNPVAEENVNRNLPRRWEDSPEAEVATIRLEKPEHSNLQASLSGAQSSAAVLLNSDVPLMEAVSALAGIVAGDSNSRCRIVVAAGGGEVDPDLIQSTLTCVPCLSIAGGSLRVDQFLRPLASSIAQDGMRIAMPSVLSACRREWIRQALAAGDAASVLDGLFWATWCWIGRPLFAREFGEVIPAAYPHLTDLRAVASKEWYVNRQVDIPERYQAESLARTGDKAPDRFHLYLSGAGGTGKSCLLRFVYDKLVPKNDVIAVWYRVDAPSSEWELVEKRVKEETVSAVAAKLGANAQQVLPETDLTLGPYLSELISNLQKLTPPVREIVVFIDQLERTFESGNEPDAKRLKTISESVIALLKDVKAGEGVRVFIASRKQYLPDFLRSFEHAEASHLEFNVLQTITDVREQERFVEKVVQWCKTQELVDPNLRIDPKAAQFLAANVVPGGHPLNLMLTLIQLLSTGVTGTVRQEAVESRRPWERLFHFDLQVAAKDDLDWHFLLAMAEARTEIVRFEEVSWRIRLIDPLLTRRAEDLGPKGILERLWLVGHLGRTIYARPDDNDPARYVEFFHANLRDYLLRDVMGTGGAELGIPGRSGGTPPAWRALDRLAAAAHEWEQTQQALPHDDILVLMRHRDVVVEPLQRKGEPQTEPFYLLFLRDTERSRERLCIAAKECFVFSALVHDEFARWAFDELFADPAEKVKCCARWLRRSDRNSRLRILQYLAELQAPDARDFLAEIVFSTDAEYAALWRELADVLAEPLYAVRYRDAVASACLDRFVRCAQGTAELPSRFGEFVVASCDGNRNDIIKTLAACAERAAGAQDPRLRQLAPSLRSSELVEAWLKTYSPRGARDASAEREVEGKVPARVQLIVGEELEKGIADILTIDGRRALSERLGLPLPDFEVRGGEMLQNKNDDPRYEVELRLSGQSVAAAAIYPSKCQVLKRHWPENEHPLPGNAICAYNGALHEVVVWVDQNDLALIKWKSGIWTAEEALLEWLELELRRNLDLLFDFDLLFEFIRDIASRLDVRRLFRTISLPVLRRVLCSLVEERVPLQSYRFELMEELQQLVGNVKAIDTLTQRLREAVGPDLSQTFLNGSERLAVITLDENLEEQLVTRLGTNDAGDFLRLSAAEARSIASEVQRHVEKSLQDNNACPVVVTVPMLRRPLFSVLQSFDKRVYTLSVTELSPALRFVLAGELAASAIAQL